MTRLLWRTDVHMSDFTPSSRTDSWFESTLSELEQVGKIATKAKVDAVIDGGDFFDIKSPSRNSHNMVKEVTRIHLKYPCPVYSCVGNHDVKYGDIRFLGESPLGVLFESGVFRRLYDTNEAIFGDVRVVGVPYHGNRYDIERFRIPKKDERYLVVVGHVLASRSGGKMFESEDVLSYDQLVEVCPDADVFCFGHWHQDQGVVNHKGKWFVNTGSMTRGSLTQDNLERKPCVVEMRFGDSIEMVRHDLDVPDAASIFNVEAKIKQDERETRMESFVASVAGTLKSTRGLDFEVSISGLDIPHEVKTRTLDYLRGSV